MKNVFKIRIKFCFALFALLFLPCIAKSQLLISQYYEGAGNDKCIEIYNSTLSPINLAGYTLQFYFNGSAVAGTTINLSGTIDVCGTWVVCDDNSNATLLSIANQISTAAFYNGDDAVGLYNGASLLDLIGKIGCDPGSEWTNLAPGTADVNFIRQDGYCSGVTTSPAVPCASNSFPSLIGSNWYSGSLAGTADLGYYFSVCWCGCPGLTLEPTANVTANSVASIACTSAQILWTASVDADNVIVVISTGAITDVPTDGVSYNANVTFGAGDELVLVDGQFVVYNGSGNSITVTGLTQGTNYNYAIFGYDGLVIDCEENYLTGGVFGSFTTITGCSSTTPQITSVMYNSCNGSSEGTDELVVFQNGSNPINSNDMTIDLPNTTWCNSGCGGNTIGNNATYVSDLNAMAGCVLFVFADPIPAGATVIIFTGNPPSSVLDYSTQCGAPGAPFYVLFLNNSSITGNFVNTGTVPKTINITFAPGVTDAVTYVAADGPGNVDGATANFDEAGNATYMTSTGCVYPLAVRLISFEGFNSNGVNKILWSSGAESHSDHYQIQRSLDGIQFESIGTVKAAGESDAQINYSFDDKFLENQPIYYYRLAMVDLDFKINFSESISIMNDQCLITYFDYQLNVKLNNKSSQNFTLNVYSTDGGLIFSTQISDDIQIPFNYNGLFIIEIPELRFHQKIVCF